MAITWIRWQSVTGAELKQSRDTLVNTSLYLGQLQNEETKMISNLTASSVCVIECFYLHYFI